MAGNKCFKLVVLWKWYTTTNNYRNKFLSWFVNFVTHESVFFQPKFNLDQPANPSSPTQTGNGNSNPAVGCCCPDEKEEKVKFSFLCFSWKRKRNHFEQNFCPLHQNQNWTKLRSVYTCDFEVRFHRVFQNLNSPENAQAVMPVTVAFSGANTSSFNAKNAM